MKGKFSDDTSHIDSLPEDKQEPKEEGKIKLLGCRCAHRGYT